MATVSRRIDAAPDKVFAVLADGWSYTNWVVGASHMRAVDDSWPEPGSRLHHATGLWPLLVRDETQVENVEPDRRIALVVRGRPLGEARVVIELESDDGGTRVTLAEQPVAGPAKWLESPPMHAVLAKRNEESLARLAALVERRTEPGA
jgi:uncharacterized protein YndB with AHSA1/START domain